MYTCPVEKVNKTITFEWLISIRRNAPICLTVQQGVSLTCKEVGSFNIQFVAQPPAINLTHVSPTNWRHVCWSFLIELEWRRHSSGWVNLKQIHKKFIFQPCRNTFWQFASRKTVKDKQSLDHRTTRATWQIALHCQLQNNSSECFTTNVYWYSSLSVIKHA